MRLSAAAAAVSGGDVVGDRQPCFDDLGAEAFVFGIDCGKRVYVREECGEVCVGVVLARDGEDGADSQ